MRKYFYWWVFACCLMLVGCGKEEPQVDTVKLYIMATTGIQEFGAPLQLMTISGTNIETVRDVRGGYIIGVDYPKGEKQKIEITGSTPETWLPLQVSTNLIVADPDYLDEHVIAYKTGTGKITVEFVP